MAPPDSPDWLPTGWTVQSIVLKTGREIRYYTNLGTGQKFFSKDDVIRYAKVGSAQKSKPQLTNRHSETKRNELVEKTIERPEWLPDGWTMDVKTQKSGSYTGKMVKIYIDPSGCKFYSRPQVLKHQISESKRKKFKKTGSTVRSARQVVVERSTDDDLPPGWIKEVKVTKNKYKTRRDPFYTDPVSGYVFHSKKDVLRYLETGEISMYAFLPKKRFINDQKLTNNEALPSSEAKRQKLEDPATRWQLLEGEGHYCTSSIPLTDDEAPKQGQEERVSAEGGLAISPTAEVLAGKHSIVEADEILVETKANCSLSESARPKAEATKRNHISTGKRPVSAPATDILPENLHEIGLEKIGETETEKTSNKSKNKEDCNMPHQSSKRLSMIEAKSEADGAPTGQALPNTTRKEETTQQLKAGPEMELACDDSADVNTPSNKSKEPLESQTIPGEKPQLETSITINNKSEPPIFLPFGDSSLDPCLEFAFKTLTGAIPVEDIANHGPISTPVADILQEKNVHESRMEGRSSGKARKIKKELNFPHRSSKRLAGAEADLVANSMSGEKTLEIASRKSSSSEANLNMGLTSVNGASKHPEAGLRTRPAHHNSSDINAPSHEELSSKSKVPLEGQNVPAVKPQELENRETNNKQTEPQPVFPFGDSWSDPCLEFAFRTLTAAMPVEDNSAIQDYFQ